MPPKKQTSRVGITTALIARAHLDYYEENGRIASYRDIAKRLGVGHNTIVRHSKNITLNDVAQRHTDKMDAVIEKLAEVALSGNVPAIKLYLQVVGKWSPKTTLDLNTNQNNTINLIQSSIKQTQDRGGDAPTIESKAIEAEYDTTDKE